MRLAPAIPWLLTRRGCPLAFDVVDADAPRPQPIIGRATYRIWDHKQGMIWYDVQVKIDGKMYYGEICVQTHSKFN